jgi:subtilisin family serine protease
MRPARKLGRRGLSVLLATAIVAAGGAPLSAAALTTAAPADQVNVIVVLAVQADLASIRGTNRRDRLTRVERALQSTATTHQRGLLTLLRARQAQHLVSSIVPLWVANEIKVTATPAVVGELAARSDVREIRPELTLQAPPASAAGTPAATKSGAVSADQATAASAEAGIDRIDAPAVWDLGYQGGGVVVASLDTGVDATHPDLASRWRGGTNSWFDPNGEHPTTPTDVSGHGTQTMGVIVGGNASGTTIGVAPQARWIAAKIFNDRGVATTTGIHQAFQWLLDPDNDPATADAPNVVNNSWDDQSTACSAEFQPDLAGLRAAGILPVFAAGNAGPTAGSVNSPANLPEALSVGGTDQSDVVDPSSSRGPSSCGQAVAPTLTAPDTTVRTSDLFGGYVTATGSSLAAPHVAGALALMLSAAPDLSADQQQVALNQGAVDLGPAGPDPDYGFGRIDVLAAYQSLPAAPGLTVGLSPTNASVSPGDAATFTVTVTPSNGFTGDAALSLTGLSAGQASWTFTPSVVPNGSGTAQLSIATAATIAAGSYPLTVIATGGATTGSASATLTVVAAPDFTVAATPTSASVNAGATATFAVSVGSVNGFADPISLTAAGIPAGVGSATITPATLSGSGTAQLVISTLGSAPAGTYPVTVTATSGTTTHTASVTLTVVVRDFAISASPTTQTVVHGKTATFTISVSAIGGYTGKVKLSRTGVPPRTTTTWSSTTVLVPGSSTFKVKTAARTPAGTYLIVVTAKCGLLSHQVTLTLVVT